MLTAITVVFWTGEMVLSGDFPARSDKKPVSFKNTKIWPKLLLKWREKGSLTLLSPVCRDPAIGLWNQRYPAVPASAGVEALFQCAKPSVYTLSINKINSQIFHHRNTHYIWITAQLYGHCLLFFLNYVEALKTREQNLVIAALGGPRFYNHKSPLVLISPL